MMSSCLVSVQTMSEALTQNDMESFSRNLQSNPNGSFNGLDSKGYSLLSKAIKLKNYDAAKALIERGANVNQRNSNQLTPLFFAAIYGNREIAELLVKNGADFHARDEHRNTPLVYALIEGQADVAVYLIEAGAALEDLGSGSFPAVFFAAKYDTAVEVMPLLLEIGQDVNYCPGNWPLISYTAQMGSVPLLEYMLDNGAHLERQAYDVTDKFVAPLTAASFSGSLDAADYLIEQGVDVNYHTDSIATALFFALNNDHPDLAQRLINAGADLSIRTLNGENYIFPASRCDGGAAILKHLLSQGLDLHERDSTDRMPIHYAVMNNNVETVRVLLKHGADPNAESRQKEDVYTPIIIARIMELENKQKGLSSAENKEIIELLLEHGAENVTASGWNY